jgi:hypothetical protein
VTNTVHHKQLSATCIVAFHNEGITAHTTLTSIAESRIFAEKHNMYVEFVITLDNHDALTGRTVRGHPGIRKNDRIETVRFGDLGLSRNYAVSKSSCEYIVCMDGDDYYSRNFILNCVLEASKAHTVIAYPEYLFAFGEKFYFTHLVYGQSAESLRYALFSSHMYCSCVTAGRAVFLEHPYSACAEGFGFEDWHWNCEVAAHGYTHSPAKDAVVLYRRKPRSLMQYYADAGAVVETSAFFGGLPAPDEPVPERAPGKSAIPEMFVPWKALGKALLFTFLRRLPPAPGERIYAALRREWRKLCKAKSRGISHLDMPDAIYKALFDIAEIDGALHPDHLPFVPQYVMRLDEAPGRAFAAAWHTLPKHGYDVIYTAPRINIGGADHMTLQYIGASCANGKSVLCIVTGEKENAPELFRQGADVLELGKFIGALTDGQRRMVLTRLLLQISPQVIHAVNDRLSLTCFARYGGALAGKSRLIASLFCDDIDAHGLEYGSGALFLRDLYANVSKIVVDNAVTARNWMNRYGLPEDFFHPVYRAIADVKAECNNPEHRDRVLWAGRCDAQKRPDIAYETARRMPDMHFDFFGKSMLDMTNAATVVRKLKKLPNVAVYGAYENFSSLPLNKYFCFLYTSQFDGLPNVLLEATAGGLPIVAPDCGGITDFITNKSGWLIENGEDVDAYIAALRQVASDYREACSRWSYAANLLRRRHSEIHFGKSLHAAYTSGRYYPLREKRSRVIP